MLPLLVALLCGVLLGLGFTGVISWGWLVFVLVLVTIALVFRPRKRGLK